jgi:hypothetical protein
MQKSKNRVGGEIVRANWKSFASLLPSLLLEYVDIYIFLFFMAMC